MSFVVPVKTNQLTIFGWKEIEESRICAWPFKEKPDFQGADILTIGNGLEKNCALVNSAIILSTEGGINLFIFKAGFFKLKLYK